MPRGDKSGPQGAGPMTGRGAGYCAGYDAPGYANPVPGRGAGMGGGRGRGRGGARGWRHWFHATGLPRFARSAAPWGAPPVTEAQETEALKAQANWLGEQLESIQQRLSELEK